MPKSTLKYADLLARSVEDLRADLKAAKEELFQLRFQLAIKQLENTAKIGEVRHRIARISAALHQQELAFRAPGSDSERRVAGGAGGVTGTQAQKGA